MVSEVIFIDESGDPGLSTGSRRIRPYYTMGFVYCDNAQGLRKRMRRLLKRLHLRKKYPLHLAELKFYLPNTELIQKGYSRDDLKRFESYMPMVRSRSLNVICREACGVFAAVVDKKKTRSTWTPETLGNFVFAQTLIVNIMNQISPANPPAILYDRGRLSPARTQRFKTYVTNKDSYFQFTGLKRYRGSLPPPIQVPSVNEPGIWAADMVAGAFYHKYTHNDWSYSDTLSPVLIGNGERLYWR
ncbi:MAG: DUF3800 domain-containing protein [Candidatus Freyarchaeota archaeon]